MRNKEIYKDRWLTWFLVAALSVAIILWGAAQHTMIQMDGDISESAYGVKYIDTNVIPEVKDGTCKEEDFDCISSFYEHEIPGYGRILDVELKSGSVSKAGYLVVSGRDGKASYMSFGDSREEMTAKGKFSTNQMANLINLIKEKDLLSMKTAMLEASNSGQNYRITVRVLSEEEGSGFSKVYSVSCAFPNCEKEFLEIKNTIMEFWGDSFICLDGCNIEENN